MKTPEEWAAQLAIDHATDMFNGSTLDSTRSAVLATVKKIQDEARQSALDSAHAYEVEHKN